ncbi:MAG: HEAT repeat domain-containing protein [Armatimonadetes bacterium]|nr:HEAT repeat domain-containing protein [Armatimonadota bacterium]
MRTICLALGLLGWSFAQLSPADHAALNSEDGAVQKAAVSRLADGPAKNLTDLTLTYLKDKKLPYRQAAEALLYRSIGKGNRAEAEEALLAALPNAATAQDQRYLIGLLGPCASPRSTSVLAVSVRDPGLREAALTALTLSSDPAVGKELLSLFETMPKGEFAGSILAAMIRRGDKEAAAAWKSINTSTPLSLRLIGESFGGHFEDKPKSVEAAVTKADQHLSAGKKREARELLAPFLDQPSYYRPAALLNWLRSDPPNGLDKACEWLIDADKIVRQTARTWLAESGQTRLGARIAKLIEAAPQEAKTELVSMLSTPLCEREASVPALVSLASSPDANVAAAAIDGLGRLSAPEGATAVSKGLASENEVVKSAAQRAAIPVSQSLANQGKKPEAALLLRSALSVAAAPSAIRQIAAELTMLGEKVDVTAMAARQGYLVSWRAAGPFPDRAMLRNEDAIDIKNPGSASWKPIALDDPTGLVDLERHVARQDNVGAYLITEFESDGVQEAVFRFGSDDDLFVWLNGALIHKFVGDRGNTADADAVRTNVVKGKNVMILKVLNGGGQWSVSARALKPDGSPLLAK